MARKTHTAAATSNQPSPAFYRACYSLIALALTTAAGATTALVILACN